MTATFKTEAELCAAFLSCIPASWVAYPETCSYDIVLAHKETGAQIGIEAKLTLNSKVLVQVTEHRERWATGPDYRAVLVGRVVAENAIIASRLGVKVLTMRQKLKWTRQGDVPVGWEIDRAKLPEFTRYKPGSHTDWWSWDGWADEAPEKRLDLPEYVPQVAAGVPAPNKLSPWLIQAIKLCIYVERVGSVSRTHFQGLKIHPSRWTQGTGWLEKTAVRGLWKAGAHFPGPRFRLAHPVSYAEIERDWPVWSAKLVAPETQQALNLG